jgi:hypothetical protein
LSRKQVHNELFLTRKDKPMTTASRGARPATPGTTESCSITAARTRKARGVVTLIGPDPGDRRQGRPSPGSAGGVETTSERFDAAARPILCARWQRDLDGTLVCRWVPERAIPTRGQSGGDERLTPFPANKGHTALDSHPETE